MTPLQQYKIIQDRYKITLSTYEALDEFIDSLPLNKKDLLELRLDSEDIEALDKAKEIIYNTLHGLQKDALELRGKI